MLDDYCCVGRHVFICRHCNTFQLVPFYAKAGISRRVSCHGPVHVRIGCLAGTGTPTGSGSQSASPTPSATSTASPTPTASRTAPLTATTSSTPTATGAPQLDLCSYAPDLILPASVWRLEYAPISSSATIHAPRFTLVLWHRCGYFCFPLQQLVPGLYHRALLRRQQVLPTALCSIQFTFGTF